MPKIHRALLESVFYLYRDEDAARSGIGAIGTGFIVGIPYGGVDHYYGISNSHVVCANGGSVIRLNTYDGIDLVDLGPEDWEVHLGGEDIAAVPLALSGEKHAVNAIPADMVLGEGERMIGVGDDVFMLGLFADHEGITRNNPVARFGNISMLASEDAPVKVKGRDRICHIVDMHSRSGFSGSPVFVYRTFGQDLTQHSGEAVKIDLEPLLRMVRRGIGPDRIRGDLDTTLHYRTMFRLLGIHFGQFSERWKIAESAIDDAEAEGNALGISPDKAYVVGVSGMTCVAPSWKILELLNQPKFRDQRVTSSGHA
jgi:hypothetical protein